MDITNNIATMTIDSDAILTSLKYQGVEQLSTSTAPLSKIYNADAAAASSNSFTSIGNGRYEIGYDSGYDVVVTIEITASNFVINGVSTGYFKFTVVSITGDLTNVQFIEVFRFNVNNVAQSRLNEDSGSWAVDASDNTLFLMSWPMSTDAVCWVQRTGTLHYYFRVIKDWGMTDVSAVLMTAPKGVYFETIKQMTVEEDLPFQTNSAGDWFNGLNPSHPSYYFRQLTPSNYESILAAMIRGGFKELLLNSPLVKGSYNVPRQDIPASSPDPFADLDALKTALESFTDAGIDIGIHGFWGRIEEDDPLFETGNIRKVAFGTLDGDIDDSVTTIDINVTDGTNFEDHDEFVYYRSRYTDTKVWIVIGNELIQAPSSDASMSTNQFTGCTRNDLGTTTEGHSDGDTVYVVIERNGIYATDDAISSMATIFATEVAHPLNITFLYADGDPIPDLNTNAFQASLRTANDERVVVWPILDAIATVDGVRTWSRLPRTGYATGRLPTSFAYSNQLATGDGIFFKIKEDTKDRKVDNINQCTPYSVHQSELGWFRVPVAVFDSGYDNDAISDDDIHYLMMKVVALNNSVGFQPFDSFDGPSPTYQRTNNRLDEIRPYIDLLEKDKILGVGTLFDASLSSPLQSGVYEGELRNTDNNGQVNEFVNKVVTNKYAVWESGTPYTFTFENTVVSPTFKLDVRPRFDYQDFDLGTHTELSDFTNDSNYSITKSDDVTCTIDVSGFVEIANNGSVTGSCNVSIDTPSSFNLGTKRGLGFRLIGDNDNDAAMRVRVNRGSTKRRQFDFTAESGTNTYILGNTNVGTSITDHRSMSWNLIDSTTVYVNSIPPGVSYSMRWLSLKGLQEKTPTSVINPIITLNTRRIIASGVTLSVNDTDAYLLNYDDDASTWSLFNSNYGDVAKTGGQTLVLPDGAIQFNVGTNSGEVTSNASDTGNGLRADITLHVYDTIKNFPILRDIPSKRRAYGIPLSFNIGAYDLDDDSLTYFSSGLPAGSTLTNNKFSWTPTSFQRGNHTSTFWVTDGELGDVQTPTITIGTVADLDSGLTVVAPEPLAGDAGEAWTDNFQVADAHLNGTSDQHLISINTQNSGTGTITNDDTQEVFVNNDDNNTVGFNLPTASQGIKLSFVVDKSSGLRVKADNNAQIRVGTGVSISGGTVFSSGVGSALSLLAINSTKWVSIQHVGTWNIDT